MHSQSFVSLLAFASGLAKASPLAVPVSEATVTELQKRVGNAGTKYLGHFPDCADDPSYATGPSQYADGTGHYVESSCDNQMYQSNSQWHCWTDLYVVTEQASYSGWENSGLTIDCSTTSTCAEFHTNLNQSCTTDTTTWDNQLGVAIQAQFPLWFGKDSSVTPSLTYNHNFGGSNEVQICTSVSDQGSCTWTDQKCHGLWFAQRDITVSGYVRRSCNTNRAGTNMAGTTVRSDGYYTVGMQDLTFTVPDNRIVGCGAMCSDTTYSDPVPGPDPVNTITP